MSNFQTFEIESMIKNFQAFQEYHIKMGYNVYIVVKKVVQLIPKYEP